MVLLRLLNLMFLLGLVTCLAGAMAGLIVFAPFVGGAWFLTSIAISGCEPHSAAASGRDELLASQAMPRRHAA
jgi:hypothetical protein